MSEIEPALTPEEWATQGISDEHGEIGLGAKYPNGSPPAVITLDFVPRHDPQEGFDTTRLHAVAALALHAQPFGFTWEDVDLVRSHASDTARVVEQEDAYNAAARDRGEDVAVREGWNAELREELARIEALADRIAALLPPR